MAARRRADMAGRLEGQRVIHNATAPTSTTLPTPSVQPQWRNWPGPCSSWPGRKATFSRAKQNGSINRDLGAVATCGAPAGEARSARIFSQSDNRNEEPYAAEEEGTGRSRHRWSRPSMLQPVMMTRPLPRTFTTRAWSPRISGSGSRCHRSSAGVPHAVFEVGGAVDPPVIRTSRGRAGTAGGVRSRRSPSPASARLLSVGMSAATGR